MEKQWPCEHIKKDQHNQWEYVSYSGRALTREWVVCPVKECLAKRPEEPKKLWEILYAVYVRPYPDENAWIRVASSAVEFFEKVVDEVSFTHYVDSGKNLIDKNELKQHLRSRAGIE